MEFITKKEWLEIFPEAREDLEEELTKLIDRFNIFKRMYNIQLDILDLEKLDSDSKDFGIMLTDIWIGGEIENIEKRIKKIYQYVRKETSTNGITEDDVERAKTYSFDGLVKFNKMGFSLCPFHKDTDASFHWNKTNNTAHCFSCDKTWDTIQFLIDTEGINFIQAVRVLK